MPRLQFSDYVEIEKMSEAIKKLERALALYKEPRKNAGEILSLLGEIVNYFEYGLDTMYALTDYEVHRLVFNAVRNRPIGGWSEGQYEMANYLLCEDEINGLREKTLEAANNGSFLGQAGL